MIRSPWASSSPGWISPVSLATLHQTCAPDPFWTSFLFGCASEPHFLSCGEAFVYSTQLGCSVSVHTLRQTKQILCTDRDGGVTDVVTDCVAKIQNKALYSNVQFLFLLYWLPYVSPTGYPTSDFSCSTFLNKTIRKSVCVFQCLALFQFVS